MTGLKEIVIQYLEGIIKSEILSIIVVNSIVILLWFVIGVIAVRITRRITYKILDLKSDNKRTITLAKLLSSIIKFVIWFVVILVILNEMNVNIAPLIASAGVLGLAIGFGAQELVKDFIAGFFIILDNTFNAGEVVEAQGFKGTVLGMGFRTTRIQNYKGEIKTVNNGDMKNVVNFSRNDSVALINFGVSYHTDLKNFTELMAEFVVLMEQKYEKLTQAPQFLGVTELANSSINMLILAKTETGTHFQMERDLRKELVLFLNEHDVEIPFPQIVVHNE